MKQRKICWLSGPCRFTQKIILNDDMLPISIGVFGNWGSGKSSLMLLASKSPCMNGKNLNMKRVVRLYFKCILIVGSLKAMTQQN